MKTWLAYHWLKLIAIVMTVSAVFVGVQITLPYAYYQFMDWIVVGAAMVTAQQAHHQDKSVVMWLCILLAVTFNPVAPMYLRTDIWQLADLVAAGFFIVAIFLLRPVQK